MDKDITKPLHGIPIQTPSPFLNNKVMAYTKDQIIERMLAIAHTEQESISSTPEERDAEYKALLCELLEEKYGDMLKISNELVTGR